jgi:hypothetical protein
VVDRRTTTNADPASKRFGIRWLWWFLEAE